MISTKSVVVLSTIALLLCPGGAFAAQKPRPKQPELIGSVRVATGRSHNLHQLPFAANVLTQSQIRSAAAPTSDAVLRTVPGVDRSRSNSAFSNYGLDRVSFDGVGNDRGLVIVDGVPAQDGFGGQVDWLAYPVADISRIEILRGIGGALYGSGAIGGVLQIDTISPSPQRQGLASFGIGNNAARTANIRYQNAVDQHISTAMYAQTTHLSYPALTPGYTTGHDSPAISQSQASRFAGRYHNADTTIDAALLTATDGQQEGRQHYAFDRDLNQYSLAVRHDGTHAGVGFGAYQRSGHLQNTADQFPATPGSLSYTQSVPTSESGYNASYYRGERNPFAARVDYRLTAGENRQTGPTGALTLDTAGKQATLGAAIQQCLNARRSELIIGGRVDRATTTGATPVATAFSPRIAARYDLGSHTAFRVSAGSGFRAPFLNELLRSYRVGAITYQNNPLLDPERSRSFAAGFDAVSGTMHFSIDGTTTLVHNALAFVTISPTVSKRENIGTTRTDGVILSDAMMIGPQTQLRLAYTTQYARVLTGSAADTGKRLAYIPGRATTISLDQKLHAIDLAANIAIIGRSYADDLNVQRLDAAAILNLSADAPIGHGGVRATLAAENLNGARYLSSIDRYGVPATLTLGLAAPL